MKQFNQLHLKSRLLAVFGIVLAAVAGLSAFTYHTTQTALKNSHWVEHTHKVIAEADDTLTALVNMETGLRGYMITGKEEYLEPYKAGRTNSQARLDSLSKLTSDNAEQVKRWNEIRQLAGKWETDFAEKGIELRRQVNSAGVPFTQLGVFTETGGGKATFDGLRAVFDAAIEAEKILLDRRNSDTAASSNLLLNVTLWGSLSVIAVGIVLALAFARSLVKPLQEVAQALETGATEVNAAASQVATSSQSLAEGSSEQAASLEETSSSLEEMSSMTKRNAENSRKANELAKLALAAAEKGVGDMQEMNAAMSGIKSSSDDIAKIIKTIDEIAFQTNILALNAAVEAARAGEAGAGFAVVADEVRNLAQRCAQAARETSSKIEGAILKTSDGVTISGRVSEALAEIARRSREVDALVAEVAGASIEQSQGISQVNLAVSQMDKVTQASASSSEESAAASEELKAQSAGLHEVVAELLALIEGRSDANPIARASTRPAEPVRSQVPPPTRPKTPTVRTEAAPVTKHASPAVRDGEFMDF